MGNDIAPNKQAKTYTKEQKIKAITKFLFGTGMTFDEFKENLKEMEEDIKAKVEEEERQKYIVELVVGSLRGHSQFQELSNKLTLGYQVEICKYIIRLLARNDLINFENVKSIPLLHIDAAIKRGKSTENQSEETKE